jgi:hypothetical protein
MPIEPERLSGTFVELADSLVTDFDVIEFLHRLATRCTELLDVTATGVLLADSAGNLRMMAASSEQMRLLELFQLQNHQGPCLDCFRSGEPVTAAEPAAVEARWPRFAVMAREHGFGAVQALPMRLRREVIGALNLFSAPPGLDTAQTHIAQALADVATIGILQYRAQHQSHGVVLQLQNALSTRVVIEQAKGVLAERLDLDMADAFTVLRDHARANHRHLSELAEAVVEGRAQITPAEVKPASPRGHPERRG